MKGILVFLLSFVFAFVSIADPACSNSSKSALVIIDMQPYFVTRGGSHTDPQNKAKMEKLNTALVASIQKAKEANIPIIFLEYDCSSCDPTDGVLKSAAANYDKVRYFKKNSDGMFEGHNRYRSELVNYLKENEIGKLIITGANGGACVFQSIRGALDNNCDVIAYNAGIADFNYREFIYPYVGYYSEHVRSEKFKETTAIDTVATHMLNYINRAPGNSSNVQIPGGTQ